MATALAESGWQVRSVLGRHAPLAEVAAAADDVDLVLIATPDATIAEVAATVEPTDSAVVAHMAGSLGLEAVACHRRPAALHPLAALPDPVIGARRLRSGCWFAVAGDPLVRELADDLGGQTFEVADSDRVLYHAAAVVASNHLVALLGQAERIARSVNLPFTALIDLARATVDNVAELGPASALTGPASRGDEVTIKRHLQVLAPSDRPAYEALAQQARQLAQARC